MARAYRWLGPGVYHLKTPDLKVRVVPPHTPGEIEHACIIRDPKEIAVMGEKLIADFIRDGRLQEINWTEEFAGIFHPDASPENSLVVRDVLEAQPIAQTALDDSEAARRAFGEPVDTISPALAQPPVTLPR